MNTLAMWSRLTPRLGIGLVLATNLQPLAVIAIGQNIENITAHNKAKKNPRQIGEPRVGESLCFPIAYLPLLPFPGGLGL